jgi:hypothetical protein
MPILVPARERYSKQHSGLQPTAGPPRGPRGGGGWRRRGQKSGAFQTMGPRPSVRRPPNFRQASLIIPPGAACARRWFSEAPMPQKKELMPTFRSRAEAGAVPARSQGGLFGGQH